MPLLHIYYDTIDNKEEISQRLLPACCKALAIAPEKLWIFWHPLSQPYKCDPLQTNAATPIVYVHCKSAYTSSQMKLFLQAIKLSFMESIGEAAEQMFIGVQRFAPGEVYVNGEIWEQSLIK